MYHKTLPKGLFIALFTASGMLLVVALLWVLDSGPLLAARAASITVDVTFDEIDGECVNDCSLRDAIIQANGNGEADTITLGAHTYTLSIAGQNEEVGATGDLDITAPLTITGQGPELTFIDANGIDRVFDLRPGAGTVVFSGITILNGDVGSANPGGGISNADADLTLTNTVVKSNAALHGGGVYVGTGTLTVNGGEISGNSATAGGGVFVATGSATLNGGRILQNTGDTWGGGALFTAPWSDADIIVSGGCIVDNSDYGVLNHGFGTLDVTDAWWGSPSGPSGAAPGMGDSVGSKVDNYTPFALFPNGCPERTLNTYTVTIATDEYDGECGIDCSLRDAIILANTTEAPDKIVLQAETYTLSIAGANENSCATGDLDVTELLFIEGTGPDQTSIDINGLDRVFDLRPGAGSMVISGVTILNGSVVYPHRGGGISSADTDLYLFNTRLQDNSAFQGGGLYVGEGSATLVVGELIDNLAQDGGGLFVATASAVLSNSRILGNAHTDLGVGGAIDTAYWASGQIDMIGGCIVDNEHTGVVHEGSGTLSAIDVWWGSTSGPSGQGPGVGDSVGTNVTYNPFATVSGGCPPRVNALVYLPVIMK